MKKITSIILMLCLTLGLSTMCYAEEEINLVANNESDDLVYFEQFLNEALIHIDTMQARNIDGEDITKAFINIYQVGGGEAANNFLIENEGSLSYVEIEQNDSGISTCADSKTMSLTGSVYHARMISNETALATLGWTMKYTGTVRYDVASGEILNVYSVSMAMTNVSCGALITPYYNSSSASSSINSSKDKVTFTGRYKMYATLGASLGDLPINTTLSFGSGYFTDQVVVSPF